jgi:sugar phosphate isomerase/epimerase
MKLSIRENMVPGDSLREKFTNLRDLGFEGVELTSSSQAELVDEIRAMTRDTGVQPSITSGRLGGCLIDARAEERELAVRSHVEALEVAAAVGAVGVISPPTITMKMQAGRPRIPDLRPVVSRDEVERRMVVALYREIARRGEELGTCIIVEPLNRYEQFWPHTLRQGVELCREVESPACKIMADLFHMHIEEDDLPSAIREAGSMIVNVHLADSQRQLPGSGHTDFAGSFRALKEIGYNGFMGLECGIRGEPMAALREAAGWLRRTYAEA